MKKNESKHWYEIKEKTGASAGLTIAYWMLKIFPPAVSRFLAYPIGFFFALFAPKVRNYSRTYLEQLRSYTGSSRHLSTISHITSFAVALVEKMQVWSGKYKTKRVHYHDDDIEELLSDFENGRGFLLMVNHLGNSEMVRALADHDQLRVSRPIVATPIADYNISSGFFAILKKINPHAAENVIDARNVGPETIELVQKKLDAGEIVVIAGDRISANSSQHTIYAPFLGKPAAFAYGAFVIASLLKAPVYFMTGVRSHDITLKSDHDIYIQKNHIDFDCPRKERKARIQQMVNEYAAMLEKLCITYPYQWYNFFDFWAKPGAKAEGGASGNGYSRQNAEGVTGTGGATSGAPSQSETDGASETALATKGLV